MLKQPDEREPLFSGRFSLPMRFYFHLHNGMDTRDEEGLDLAGEQAALLHARAEARVMAAESVRNGHLNLSHCIEVSDVAGSELFRVTFAQVLAITH